MFRRRKFILISLAAFCMFIFVITHLMNILTKEQIKDELTNTIVENKIKHSYLPRLAEKYRSRNKLFSNITNLRIENLSNTPLPESILSKHWREVNSWVSKGVFMNITSPNLGNILGALKYSKIIYADLDSRGTQLKLLLTLEGNQQVVFKPKWYNKDKVVEGQVYAGKDRYGAEILAFYLSILLNVLLVPLSVERSISVKNEIMPVASSALLTSSFNRNGSICIYGKCYYCKKEDPICCDNNSLLTGALIFNVKADLSMHRSPWQRTYKKLKQAAWEQDYEFCRIVKNKLVKKRLYDLIDIAIFDFLLQNGDRHHYEVMNNQIVYIDNGKGLGNPFVTHMDILAPLYQCCMLRKSTWDRLTLLSGGVLTEKLSGMPDIHNFVTNEHLAAIEERLLIVYATVEYCKNKNSNKVETFL